MLLAILIGIILIAILFSAYFYWMKLRIAMFEAEIKQPLIQIMEISKKKY